MINRFPQSLLVALVVATAYATIAALTGAGLVDDAYIFLRYAQHIAQSAGPVFNLGERVEGYTSPVWLAMVVPLFAFRSEPSVLVSALSAICGVACAAVLWRTRGDSTGVRLLRGAFLVTNPAFIFWSWSGLDTAAFSLILLVSFMLLVPASAGLGRTVAAGVAFCIAALTRMETLWLMPLAMIAVVRRGLEQSRNPVRELLLFFIPGVLGIGTHMFWRHSFYGQWLPNTFFAKAGLPEWLLVKNGLRYIFKSLITLSLVAIAFARTLRQRDLSEDSVAAVAVSLSWVFLLVLLGGDHFPYFRFLVPLLPIVALGVLPRRAAGGRRTAPQEVRVLAVFLIASNLMLLGLPDRRAARWEVQQARGWSTAGHWLAIHFPPETRIASPVVGAIPYYSQLETVDLLGLTDSEIARHGNVYASGVPGHQRYDSDYVLSRKPDLIVLPSSGLYDRITITPWPSVQPLDFGHFFALHDLLERPETHARYEPAAFKLLDGTYVELLRARGELR